MKLFGIGSKVQVEDETLTCVAITPHFVVFDNGGAVTLKTIGDQFGQPTENEIRYRM